MPSSSPSTPVQTPRVIRPRSAPRLSVIPCSDECELIVKFVLPLSIAATQPSSSSF
eukprot:IDg15681t1